MPESAAAVIQDFRYVLSLRFWTILLGALELFEHQLWQVSFCLQLHNMNPPQLSSENLFMFAYWDVGLRWRCGSVIFYLSLVPWRICLAIDYAFWGGLVPVNGQE